MAKRKKKKQTISEKEFIFNFLSLTIVIIIGLYFGGRSIYFYSKQNMSIKADSKTLNGLIVSKNKIVKNGDGLYRDNDGYFFKGEVNNNYVLFGNSSYRIIRINNDSTVKLVSNELVASFMWGEDSKYELSNLKHWLSQTVEKNSGVFYNSLPNPDNFLVKTDYKEDILKDGDILDSNDIYKDYVTTLSISDYILAGGKKSYLNTKKIFYLLGLTADSDNLFVDADGSVKACDSLEGYGIRAVITLKKDLLVSSGDGSKERPFVINQGDNKNYVNSFVKLENDLYQVFEESDEGILKMYKSNYVNINNQNISLNYSSNTSHFDLKDTKNIANYLNTTYLNSLSYAHLLVDNYFFTGEVSAENNYKFNNIYTNNVICKVGLLNIFDYVSNSTINNFFYLNTTSNVGTIQYSRLANGMLEEVNVKESRNIVPVISINKSILKGGKGLELDPYVVG